MTNTKVPVTRFIVKVENLIENLKAVSGTKLANGLTDLPIK